MPLPQKTICAKHSFQYSPTKKAFLSASLTIECALILPLMFMMLITLISVMNAFTLQANTSLTLSEKLRKTAVAAYVAHDRNDDRPLSLSATDKLDFPLSPLPVPAIKVRSYARVYPWIGASDSFAAAWSSSEHDGMVYVAKTRSVYHLYSDCSFLNVTIIETSTDLVHTLRNANGSRYKKSPGFPDNYAGPVYVTPEGEFYYPSTNASSLIRHIYMVDRSEIDGLKLCSRCQARFTAAHAHD